MLNEINKKIRTKTLTTIFETVEEELIKEAFASIFIYNSIDINEEAWSVLIEEFDFR